MAYTYDRMSTTTARPTPEDIEGLRRIKHAQERLKSLEEELRELARTVQDVGNVRWSASVAEEIPDMRAESRKAAKALEKAAGEIQRASGGSLYLMGMWADHLLKATP